MSSCHLAESILTENATNQLPASAGQKHHPALPVTTTKISVFYLAQSACITTRTTPVHLKCVKMQRRLNTDTLCMAKIIN
jgi:hypothetical protein